MSITHLITANTHRFKEGARILEDIARFVFKDESLFKKVRELRHAFQITMPIFEIESDPGGSSFLENNTRNNLMELVQANSSRMQEALRVLEEFEQDSINKHKLKSLRFATYHLQVDFCKKTKQFTNHDKLTGLYLIVDVDIIKRPMEVIANVINNSSVNLIQFRSKLLSKRPYLQNALKFKTLLHPEKIFIINDHIDIAIDIADGVHLGQEDYDIKRVHKILPDHFLFGVSCHSLEEAKWAVNAGASYLSVGCLFPTKSKKNIQFTSLDELQKIQQNTSIPICAIGGINLKNLSIVLSYKIQMVAVISSIWQELDPAGIINCMQEKII